MGLEVIIPAVGLALSAAGTGISAYGAVAQSSASRRAEGARKSQMELESNRKNREILRRTQVARATALANTTSQTGSSATSGSSALPGAYGEIRSQEDMNRSYNATATERGRDIFAANSDVASAQSISAIGNGVQRFGAAMMTNYRDINQIGTSLFMGDRSGAPRPSQGPFNMRDIY